MNPAVPSACLTALLLFGNAPKLAAQSSTPRDDTFADLSLPKVKFDGASFQQAVEGVMALYHQQYPGDQRFGGYLCDSQPDDAGKVTLDFHDVPMSEACRYIAELSVRTCQISPRFVSFVQRLHDEGCELLPLSPALQKKLQLKRSIDVAGVLREAARFSIHPRSFEADDQQTRLFQADGITYLLARADAEEVRLLKGLFTLLESQPPRALNMPAKISPLWNSELPRVEISEPRVQPALEKLLRLFQAAHPDETRILHTEVAHRQVWNEPLQIHWSKITLGEACQQIATAWGCQFTLIDKTKTLTFFSYGDETESSAMKVLYLSPAIEAGLGLNHPATLSSLFQKLKQAKIRTDSLTSAQLATHDGVTTLTVMGERGETALLDSLWTLLSRGLKLSLLESDHASK